MSLTAQSPQPIRAWSFDGTTTDYITGSSGTVIGTSPSYVSGVYKQALYFPNTAGATPTSNISYTLPSLSSTAFTVALWFNASSLSTTNFPQIFAMTGLNAESDLRIEILPTAGPTFTFRSIYNFSASYVGPTTSSSYNIGTWIHLAATVQTSSTSNVITLYVNGSFVGNTSSTTNTPRTFSILTLGSFCDGKFLNAFNGSIDDLRIFNTALTAAQVQAIYNAQGMPRQMAQTNTVGSTKTTLTGTPLFSQLSASAVASSVGAFSLRAVNGTTAKAVQVRRSSDSATQDFYADRLGNLLTAPVVGQSLAVWLGGATGYVTTWYDQSGQGKDLVQPTAANQAVINTATSPCSLIFNGTSTNMYNSNFTFNFGATYNYTIRALVDNTVGGCLVYKGASGFPWNLNGYKKWWLGTLNGGEATTGGYPSLVGNGEGYVFGQSAISSSKSSVTWSSSAFSSVALYENASSVTVNYSRLTVKSDPNSYLYIGAGGSSAYYKGNIYEIEIFSTPLSTSDVTILG